MQSEIVSLMFLHFEFLIIGIGTHSKMVPTLPNTIVQMSRCLLVPRIYGWQYSGHTIKRHHWLLTSCLPSSRYGEPGGVRPGGARLQNAVSSRVPRVPAWPDVNLLEERAWREAHVWVPAELPGGLLHLHGASVPAGREPVNVHVLKPAASWVQSVTLSVGGVTPRSLPASCVPTALFFKTKLWCSCEFVAFCQVVADLLSSDAL